MRNALVLLFSISLGLTGLAQKEQRVKIATDSGDITLKLYGETPLHQQNFVKLVGAGFYDGTAFHRVIENFMIQGGDPNSKEGGAVVPGQGGPGYKVPAEIRREFIHVKGALSAARQGDNTNPRRESSGSQFYLVQGRVFDDEALDQFESRINQDIRNQMMRAFFSADENEEYRSRLQICQMEKDQEAIKVLLDEVNPILDAKMGDKKFEYTEEERTLYKTIGGTPHLDMQYTVYGQVEVGIDVIDKLASIPKQGESPITPSRMTMTLVE